MQPNFEAMSNAELRAYALSHRNAIEPLRELYRRRTPDSEAAWFKLPQTEDEERQQFEQFKQILSQRESSTD
jgi:hypothetical protein